MDEHRGRKPEATGVAELVPLLYDELRRVAGACFRRQPRDHTLQPTALVHEAYLRLAERTGLDWNDRTHFLRIAARAVREVLVDHARRRMAAKRGGHRLRVTLHDAMAASTDNAVDLLGLEEALAQLEAMDERKARVVELRFFTGLTIEQTAEIIGVSPKTVEADWYGARAWLHRELSKGVTPP